MHISHFTDSCVTHSLARRPDRHVPNIDIIVRYGVIASKTMRSYVDLQRYRTESYLLTGDRETTYRTTVYSEHLTERNTCYFQCVGMLDVLEGDGHLALGSAKTNYNMRGDGRRRNYVNISQKALPSQR